MIVRLFFYLQWVLLVASCVSTLSSAAFLGPSSSKSTGRCSMLAALASSPPVRPNENTGPIGLYVHIPYCRRRCRYCDFAIVPIGPNAATEGAVDNDDAASQGFLAMNRNYTAALLKEIGMIQSSEKVQLRSVYFGGGTPSLAPLETLQEILDAIRSSDGPFVLQKDAEISIEMDPGTFSKDKLRAVKDMGFNRISLGVQVCTYIPLLSRLETDQRRNDMITHSSYFHSTTGTCSPLTIAFWNRWDEYTSLKMCGNP